MTHGVEHKQGAGRWEPVEEWDEEQPQRCTICKDILCGRELGYLPSMCLHDGCPGPPQRRQVRVRVVEAES